MITRDGRSRANFPWTSSRRSEVATGPCFKRGARPRASRMGRSLSSPIRLRRSVSLAIEREIAHRRDVLSFDRASFFSPFRSISFFLFQSRRRDVVSRILVFLRQRSTRRKYTDLSLSPPPSPLRIRNRNLGCPFSWDASSGKSADRFLCPSRRLDVNNFYGGEGRERRRGRAKSARRKNRAELELEGKDNGEGKEEEEEGKVREEEDEEEEEEWKDKSWRGFGP